MNKQLAFLILILALPNIFLACSSDNKDSNSEFDKKNILLIVSDSLCYDAIEAHGGEAKTPNINYLIKNGASFSNAYTTSPRTMPTSVSLLTGKNPAQYPFIDKKDGIRGHYIVPDSEYLFAEFLSDKGYDTTAYLTNPNSYLSNNTQGFKLITEKEKISATQAANISSITGPIKKYLPYHKVYSFIDYLLNLPSSKNFYSLLWIIDPHVPFVPPAEFEAQLQFNKNQLPRSSIDYSWAKSYIKYTDYEKEYTQSLYDKEIEAVDERVGYIIQALKSKRLLGKTIIVFTSDHGEHFGEHGYVGHGNTYFEELLHVPLIISGPGIPKGKNINARVSLADLPATLNDLLKLDKEYFSAGASFDNLLSNTSKRDKSLFFTGVRPQDKKYRDAVLSGSYKLISLFDGSSLLYDLSKDPEEEQNLTSNQNDIYMRLKKILEVFRNQNSKARELNKERIKNNHKNNSLDEKESINRLKSLGYLK